MTREEKLMHMGANCKLLGHCVDKADKCLYSLFPEHHDIIDHLTSDEYDAFWNGYHNKPEHWQTVISLDMAEFSKAFA